MNIDTPLWLIIFKKLNLKYALFESFEVNIKQNISRKLSFIFKAKYLKKINFIQLISNNLLFTLYFIDIFFEKKRRISLSQI